MWKLILATCHDQGCSIDNPEREQKIFFTVVGEYFSIVFSSTTTEIPEGVVTLKEVHPPSEYLTEQPYMYGSVCAKQFAGYNFPYEVVCCPYFPVRLQSQIIDDYGIISCHFTQLL